MKFLIIMRRVPGAHGFPDLTPEHLEEHAENIKKGLDAGNVHFACAFLSGGGAYVVEADSAKKLGWAVRDNPMFRNCSVEIEPIVDADAFLKAAAKAKKKMKG
jgi:hypothetical protein